MSTRTTEVGDGFDEPHEISMAQRMFPAGVVGTLMPEMDDIPAEFQERGTDWNRFVSDLFFNGQASAFNRWNLYQRDEIDGQAAFTHLMTVLGSYEPKHEHKEAAVAWLASRWFEGIEEKG